jgi:hypothetical protein
VLAQVAKEHKVDPGRVRKELEAAAAAKGKKRKASSKAAKMIHRLHPKRKGQKAA